MISSKRTLWKLPVPQGREREFARPSLQSRAAQTVPLAPAQVRTGTRVGDSRFAEGERPVSAEEMALQQRGLAQWEPLTI